MLSFPLTLALDSASTPLLVTVAGQIVLFLTGLAAVMVPLWKDSRNRRWARMDKAEADKSTLVMAEKVREDARIMKEAMERVHDQLTQQIRHSTAGVSNTVMLSRELLTEQLKAGNLAAVKAYDEANNVNLKLKELAEAIAESRSKIVEIRQPEGKPLPVDVQKPK